MPEQFFLPWRKIIFPKFLDMPCRINGLLFERGEKERPSSKKSLPNA
ncbi:rCG58736 [Rattus norvegicus]|uniref:RCG58736 n=1 Tax=Rattus norvegicus TaxID=10116 RepID=A6JL26_RAT|nr:rCG58736 [Rattus norvegicus]